MQKVLMALKTLLFFFQIQNIYVNLNPEIQLRIAGNTQFTTRRPEVAFF